MCGMQQSYARLKLTRIPYLYIRLGDASFKSCIDVRKIILQTQVLQPLPQWPS